MSKKRKPTKLELESALKKKLKKKKTFPKKISKKK